MRLLLIPVILISISCTNNKKEQNEKIKPKIESVIINTDTLGIPSYPVFSHYLKYTDLHFIGYNDLLHSLDIYNLTEEKFIDRIILDSDGPKSVGPINGLYYHNKDSIFTFSRGKISLFDEGYTSFHYFDLFQIIQEQNLDFEPIINQHFRLIYDPISKTIPLQNIFYGNKKSYAPNKNLISKLNIKENRIEEIPFTHTEQYEYVDEFGFLNYTTFSSLGDGHILANQVYSPKTIKINLVNNKTENILKSNKDDFYSNQDLNNWQKHAIKSTYYNQIIKLDSDKFTRIIWSGVDPENGKNGFLEKSQIIQLFDAEMNCLKEIELPANTYGIYSWFTSQNQLYLQTSHPLYEDLIENSFEIHRISFE